MRPIIRFAIPNALHAALLDRRHQGGVIALGLVAVGLREIGQGGVEGFGVAAVTCNFGDVAGAGMSTGQQCPTGPYVTMECAQVSDSTGKPPFMFRICLT